MATHFAEATVAIHDHAAAHRQHHAILDAIEAGVGLTSMRDRLAAVGGDLAIVTAPGKGTRVIGRIPLGQRLPRAVPPRGTAREL